MTLQFSSVSEIIGGSVLVEQVFSYPGLGQAAGAVGDHRGGPRRRVSAGEARFSLPAWHLGRMFFCSSLTAPLLYRIKMEFLCEEFEQIENKRSRCTSFCTAAPFFTIFL